ncbi:MAG: NAD(P)/FAD-dependent oxidoreductase, partial [Candidatus Omnitrophica bacterium]|nr:NAD(P)/FAD-dependent oxidoreductase [Candidatus Omnitrophota bacterium]
HSSVSVVGGGVIGCELASIFASFGVKVTIYEMMPRILPEQDDEIVSLAEKFFQQRGIQISPGKPVENLDRIKEEKVLLAIGRKARITSFQDRGLATENGAVKVDQFLQTNLPSVYAAGDVNGRYQFAYVATREGLVAAANIMGKRMAIDYENLPVSIFTNPEIASCGFTERQAKNQGIPVKLGRFPFSALGRAKAEGKTDGLVKVIAEAETLRILGIHIIGGQATELVATATFILKNRLSALEVEKVFFCHPTFSEAIMEAAADAAGQCFHLPPLKNAT